MRNKNDSLTFIEMNVQVGHLIKTWLNEYEVHQFAESDLFCDVLYGLYEDMHSQYIYMYIVCWLIHVYPRNFSCKLCSKQKFWICYTCTGHKSKILSELICRAILRFEQKQTAFNYGICPLYWIILTCI